MSNVKIDDLTTTELEELDLIADPEDYLRELSEQEEIHINGGCLVIIIDKKYAY
jgi:hypothetical protein